MTMIAAWVQSLREMPKVWQSFFLRKTAYEGKSCDSREEVLRVNDIAEAHQLLGEQRLGDESEEEKAFHD